MLGLVFCDGEAVLGFFFNRRRRDWPLGEDPQQF